MQSKMENEKRSRQQAESKLLEMEKQNSEISVDISQLHQQVAALKTDVRNENDKVRRPPCWIYDLLRSLIFFWGIFLVNKETSKVIRFDSYPKVN